MNSRRNTSSAQAPMKTQPLTHIEALELDRIPEHLLVGGGGYVGVELSQAMRRFGSKVTIIGRSGRLMAWASPMRK
jgi:pyruvate/2-oxoglutarate dehydrogenase complex dihydrolipoamide dehydrogenase (E3) component